MSEAWNSEHQLIVTLILGCYAALGGAYIWAWILHCFITRTIDTKTSAIEDKVDQLEKNHIRHLQADNADLKDRVFILEQREDRRDQEAQDKEE